MLWPLVLMAAGAVVDDSSATCILRGELRTLRNGETVVMVKGEPARVLNMTTAQRAQTAALAGRRVIVTSEWQKTWRVMSIEAIEPITPAPTQPPAVVEKEKPADEPMLTPAVPPTGPVIQPIPEPSEEK